MIIESTVRPKPQNSNAKIAFLVSMLLFLLTLATYMTLEKYRGVVALVSICFLTSAILFFTKFLASVMYYDIKLDSEGIPIFVVRQQTGKRMVTLARIEIADIEEIISESREERKKHKTPAGVLKYNYGPTLNPKNTLRLIHKSRYENSEIIIEATEEYANALREYSVIAKTLRAESGDE